MEERLKFFQRFQEASKQPVYKYAVNPDDKSLPNLKNLKFADPVDFETLDGSYKKITRTDRLLGQGYQGCVYYAIG